MENKDGASGILGLFSNYKLKFVENKERIALAIKAENLRRENKKLIVDLIKSQPGVGISLPSADLPQGWFLDAYRLEPDDFKLRIENWKETELASHTAWEITPVHAENLFKNYRGIRFLSDLDGRIKEMYIFTDQTTLVNSPKRKVHTRIQIRNIEDLAIKALAQIEFNKTLIFAKGALASSQLPPWLKK